MDVRQLRYFIAVAEELHFGRAAKRLHMSQPPISEHVRQLEEEIGAKLFHRTKRKVELTNAGKVLYAEAGRLLAQLQRAAYLTREAGDGKIGHLALAYAPSCSGLVARVLRRFKQRYPNVEVSLHSQTPEQQPEALSRGDVDVAFSVFPIDADGLRTETLSRKPLLVAINEHHPLAKLKQVPINALAQYPFIFFPRQYSSRSYDFVLAFFRTAGINPRVAYEADNLQMFCELLKEGHGFALVWEARAFGFHGIISRPLTKRILLDVGLTYSLSNRSALLQSFLSVVRSAPVN